MTPIGCSRGLKRMHYRAADDETDGRAHLLADRDEQLADSRADDRCAP